MTRLDVPLPSWSVAPEAVRPWQRIPLRVCRCGERAIYIAAPLAADEEVLRWGNDTWLLNDWRQAEYLCEQHFGRRMDEMCDSSGAAAGHPLKMTWRSWWYCSRLSRWLDRRLHPGDYDSDTPSLYL